MKQKISGGRWQALKAALESKRDSLNAEISAYPPPIPACDAQFNHLLEQRSGINRELQRLDRACAKDEPGAVERFVSSCPFLADSGES